LFLIGGRGEITKSLLPSLPIVKDFDVRRDLPYSFLPGFVTAMMNEFVFQHTPKTLNGRVVIAVPTAAHRCPHFELVKEFSVARGAVLTATVGMMNQTSRRPLGSDSAKQGLGDQILCHAFSHGVAHNLSGKKILVTGKI
jgi:hypothetical protein